MTTLREAAQQALEQLKINRTNFRKGPSKSICKMLAGGNDEAIADLEAALAEPVQEPVAKVIATAPTRIWLDLGFDPEDEDITFDQLFEATWSQDNATGGGIEYVRADLSSAPQRKPLSDDELLETLEQIDRGTKRLPWDYLAFARAIERAHGIKDAGCDYCRHPLYAAIKCRSCGRVTE